MDVREAGDGNEQLVLATNGADALSLNAIADRHAEVTATMAAYATRIVDVAVGDDVDRLDEARNAFLAWGTSTLMKLLTREAAVLYPAVRQSPDGDDLAAGLRSDLARIEGFFGKVGSEPDPASVAAAAVALRVAVGHHLDAETRYLLPLLALSPDHRLADLWAEVERALLSAVPSPEASAECACGVVDEPAFPELDVRDVPHAIRHATVFGALESLSPGRGLVLIAPHDPLPLLAQIRRRTGGRFAVTYLQRGPEKWRLAFVHG